MDAIKMECRCPERKILLKVFKPESIGNEFCIRMKIKLYDLLNVIVVVKPVTTLAP